MKPGNLYYGSCNIRCDTCANTSDLMEAIRERDYDLLITDLRMPETNGYDVLKLLRSSNVGNSQTIQVIVTTAWGNCDEQSLLVLIHYLCVNLCRADFLVSKKFADGVNVCPEIEHHCSKGVPPLVEQNPQSNRQQIGNNRR